jgi:hypothetical protein
MLMIQRTSNSLSASDNTYLVSLKLLIAHLAHTVSFTLVYYHLLQVAEEHDCDIFDCFQDIFFVGSEEYSGTIRLPTRLELQGLLGGGR